MKKCLLFTSLMALSFTGFGQVELLNEDFSQGIPATWTVIDKDGLTPNAVVSEYTTAWISAQSPTDTTNLCISSTSYFNPIGKADRWIVTPAIQLGQFGNYISFKAISYDPSFPDSYSVKISKHLVADSFINVRSVLLENPEWTERDFSLSETGMEGEMVYLAIVNNSEDAFKLYIDDLKVRKEDPLKVKEQELVAATIYPNPTTGKLTISSTQEISRVGIYTNEGRLMAEIIDNFTNIDLQEFQSGTYLLKLYSGNDFTVKRIVKI